MRKITIIAFLCFYTFFSFGQTAQTASVDSIKMEMMLKAGDELNKYTDVMIARNALMAGSVLAVGGNVLLGDSKTLGFTLGGVFFLSSVILDFTAQKHIGRSGAYLEAYANGVRITF